jgi:UDP-3-O-[3-hydroxymyristoyl] glucosamine N-acyltransferase
MKILLKREIILTELQKLDDFQNLKSAVFFNEISSIKFNNENAISFYQTENFKKKNFKGVIISNNKNIDCKYLIFSENPKYDFAKIVYYLSSNNLIIEENKTTINKKAIIHKTAVIEEGVSIGENSLIGENAVIKKGTVIGNNCKIGANSVIGNEGFGVVNKPGHNNLRFPQLGKVLINNNVEIGNSNTIDKGALENTIIEEYVFTDNQVHIGHASRIGKNTIITAGNIFGGGVSVGENCFIGINSSLKDNISLGDNVFVGMGSNVISNIIDNTIVAGNPAKNL